MSTVAFMRLMPMPDPVDDLVRAVAEVIRESEAAGAPVSLELKMKLSVVLEELRTQVGK